MTSPPRQPLDYETQPARSARAAWIRGSILVAVVLVLHIVIVLLFHPLIQYSEYQTLLGGGTLGTPAAPFTEPGEKDFNQITYSMQAGGYLVVLLVSQWLFLRRPRGWRLDKIGGEKLTPTSAIVAGMIAMLLCIGLLATLMELPNWWHALTRTDPSSGADYRQAFGIVWIAMFVTWLIWAMVFWRYGRNLDRCTFTGKILRKLLAGTIIELFIAGVAHAWVIRTRGSECYCTRGSYTGIVFGVTALVWLFGPGVWFLLQREKRRRERLI